MKALWTELLIQEHFDNSKHTIPIAAKHFKTLAVTTSRAQGVSIISQVRGLWSHISTEGNPSPVIVLTKPFYFFWPDGNPPWQTESWEIMADWLLQFNAHVGLDCETWLLDYKLDRLSITDEELDLFVDNLKTFANKFDRVYIYGISPWLPYQGAERIARAVWSIRTKGMFPYHNRYGSPYERNSWVANWGTMESFNVNRPATKLGVGTKKAYEENYIYHKPWPAELLIQYLNDKNDQYDEYWRKPIFLYGNFNEFVAEWDAIASTGV